MLVQFDLFLLGLVLFIVLISRPWTIKHWGGKILVIPWPLYPSFYTAILKVEVCIVGYNIPWLVIFRLYSLNLLYEQSVIVFHKLKLLD